MLPLAGSDVSAVGGDLGGSLNGRIEFLGGGLAGNFVDFVPDNPLLLLSLIELFVFAGASVSSL